MSKRHTDPSGTGVLTEGVWRTERVGDSLAEVLGRAVGEAGARWHGLALTTRGARAVTGVSADGLEASDGAVDSATVFELRLWATAGAQGGARARELRWLNGSGGVEVTVWEGSAAPTSVGEGPGCGAAPCRLRRGSYLQHAPAGREARQEMSVVEVFCTEERYGNVVFADELMTGRWA